MVRCSVVSMCPKRVKKDEDDLVTCLACEVVGARPRGRPKNTWKELVDSDLKCLHLHVSDALGAVDVVQNRPMWRMLSAYGVTQP